jgi:hypothetical protein
VKGQWVQSSDWRKEAGDDLNEPLPAEACRLAAPLERCEPEPRHLVAAAVRAYPPILDNFPNDPVGKFLLEDCEEMRTGNQLASTTAWSHLRPFQSFSVCKPLEPSNNYFE